LQIRGLKVLALFLAGSIMSGCVTDQSAQNTDDGWTVRCNTDAVTNASRCFAGTFGRPAGADGTPFAGAGVPLQVFFVNGQGPYVQAGWHSFPGRYPLIRFDNDQRAFTVPDDGMGGRRTSPSIVNRMLTAKVARVRFDTWPDGSQDMVVSLDGFPQAWAALNASN
jgi:hypothetical protein